MSRGRLGLLQGASSRLVRRAEARPPGPDRKSTASRAMAWRSAACACGDSPAALLGAPGTPASAPFRTLSGLPVPPYAPSVPSGPVCVLSVRSSALLPGLSWAPSAPSAVRAVGTLPAAVGVGQGQVDDAVDDGHVRVPDDYRDGERVAGGGHGVVAGEVAGLACPAREPGRFHRRAGRQASSCPSPMWTLTWVSAPARSG